MSTKMNRNLSPKELTCIDLSSKILKPRSIYHRRTLNFTALIDGGSNCCIVSREIVDKLGLSDYVANQATSVQSFTGEKSTFDGLIELEFSIGDHSFKQLFFVKNPHLATGTDALLGVNFLNSAEVSIQYGPHGQIMFLRGIKVPIVERAKRRQKCGNNMVTYTTRAAVEPVQCEVKQASAAEHRKINPLTGAVTRVILPGSEWPEQITLEQSEIEKGFVVEDQLVTTKRNTPTPKAKCRESCTRKECAIDCPTTFYWYAHCLVFNVSNRPIYLRPGQLIASIEPQVECPELTQKVNEVINEKHERYVNSILEINKKLNNTKLKNAKRRLKKKLQKQQAESEPTGVEEQSLEIPKLSKSKQFLNSIRRGAVSAETNFLHLDPVKNREEYRREYLKKHKPQVPLDQRRERVKELLETKHPELDPRAKTLLLKYSEVVHLESVPFVGTKTVSHKIIYNGPVFFNRQYRTPHVLENDIAKEIDRLIDEGLIEPSESEFNNAFLPVAKQCPVTGKLKIRVCLDMRNLNSNIIVDRIPINDVQCLIDKLSGVKFMTVIDAASGYLQIPLTKDSQKYTAFKFQNKSFSYKKNAIWFRLSSRYMDTSYERCSERPCQCVLLYGRLVYI